MATILVYSKNFWEKLVSDVLQAETIKSSAEFVRINNDSKQLLQRIGKYHSLGYGSRLLGTASDESVFNITADVTTFNEEPTDVEYNTQLKFMQTIRESEFQNTFRCINRLGDKVITVIASHIPSGIECHFSFWNDLAHCEYEMFNYLFEFQPIGRYMCVFLRQWMKDKGLWDAFRSHINTLMVIFFLQTKNLLPSIQKLQEGLSSDMGPWISKFNKTDLTSLGMEKYEVSEKGTRAILKEFFEYYANFNYTSNIVCPYLGFAVSKNELMNRMPLRARNYTKNKIILDSAIIVQNFVRLNQNMASSINKFRLGDFKNFCSAMKLQNI